MSPTHHPIDLVRHKRQGARLLLLAGTVALSGWVLSGCETSNWPKKQR